MTSRTQSGRQRDVKQYTSGAKKSGREKSSTTMTRTRWELLTALKNNCHIVFTQSQHGPDKARVVRNDGSLSFVRSLPTVTANLFIRNRWVRTPDGTEWRAGTDDVLRKIYVLSPMGLETLRRVKEPPEAETVWYRCSQCGDKWKYRARGRPPENCDVCGEKDCMKKL